jgi:hypothetical protein
MNARGRLDRLARLWPQKKCAACLARPAIVCVGVDDDDAPPVYDVGPCPRCGQMRWSVPVLVGVDCDAI